MGAPWLPTFYLYYTQAIVWSSVPTFCVYFMCLRAIFVCLCFASMCLNMRIYVCLCMCVCAVYCVLVHCAVSCACIDLCSLFVVCAHAIVCVSFTCQVSLCHSSHQREQVFCVRVGVNWLNDCAACYIAMITFSAVALCVRKNKCITHVTLQFLLTHGVTTWFFNSF